MYLPSMPMEFGITAQILKIVQCLHGELVGYIDIIFIEMPAKDDMNALKPFNHFN